MKKYLYGLFLALLLALCLVPSVGMLLAGPQEADANEQLATLPEEWSADYPAALAEWVDDRFYLRSRLITLDRLATAALGTSGEPEVVLGSNGWLYFSETLGDYTGTATMSDRELDLAAHNLSLMAQYCREEQKQFLFVAAPNKNSLYPQNMPYLGVRAEQTAVERLQSSLAALGVPYGDVYGALLAQPECLYFAHDSHWNSRGAALGADVINAGFQRPSEFFAMPHGVQTPHQGDLYAMLYPGLTDPEQDACWAGLDFTFLSPGTRPDAIRLKTQGQGEGSLLAYRDSFGNLLFPYLAHSYGEATFSRSVTYDLTAQCEYLLIELVERNFRYLITNVPVMPAPEAALTLPGESLGTLTAKAQSRNGFTLLTGTVPEAADGVYAVCGGRALQCFLLQDDGYGVNLPAGEAATHLVYTVGDRTLMYEIVTEGE